MEFIEDKKDFPRRLKLFIAGVIIGSIVMYFSVFKGRNIYKSPQEVVIGKLLKYPSEASEAASKKIRENNISTDEIKELLNNGDVKFSQSEVHKKPCPIYKIENELSDKKLRTVFFELCDSTSRLIDIVYKK
jgi:hypothetical protein